MTDVESKSITVNPKELDVELAAHNGFRVSYRDGFHNCKIQVKDNEEWRDLKYIQKIVITLDVKDPLPKVQLDYIIA